MTKGSVYRLAQKIVRIAGPGLNSMAFRMCRCEREEVYGGSHNCWRCLAEEMARMVEGDREK